MGARTSAQGILRVFLGRAAYVVFSGGKRAEPRSRIKRSRLSVAVCVPLRPPAGSRKMGSDEDGVHAEAVQPDGLYSSQRLVKIGCFDMQIFRKTAANLEAVPEYAHGTPRCETYRQKCKRKSGIPLSETGCRSILLLGLVAVLDSLSNRSCWRP